MSVNISTSLYRYDNANRLLTDLQANNYYFFVGDHVSDPNSTLVDINDDSHDITISPYFNMIFGKSIANTDAALLINNIQWTTNTVYSMYDDQDTNIINENFYVINLEGSYYHIWKCLDNNNGNPSTVAPQFAAGANTALYQTSDGYRWKYMTSVDTTTASKFKTTSYFPIVANTSVVNQAVPGAYDVFKILNQGAKYNNYIDGTFSGSDIRLGGNTVLYNISNSVAQPVAGYYTGCLIYLSSGTGQGQFKTIVDYVSNTTGNIIVLDSGFTTPPLNGTQFQIRPSVNIVPVDTTPTLNCVARALVNAINSNSIYRIEVLQRGSGYLDATATVVANSIIGITNTAVIRAINGPYGGHGYWQYQELYVNSVEASVTLANTIGGLVPATNYYRQIGIFKNPQFSNVVFAVTSNHGNFSVGEKVYSYTPIQINTGVTVTSGSPNVTCNTANWTNQVAVNNWVVVSSSDGTLNFLTQVNSISNSSQIILTENMPFTVNTAVVSLANLISNAVITTINSTNNFNVTNCYSNFTASSRIIGKTSGATGVLNTFSRNGVSKDFSTFNQLHKYNITVLSGAFVQNEVVRQGNTSGILFDSNTLVMFVSNFSNTAFTLGQVVGETSLATANITQTFAQEIIPKTGTVMYLENISTVNRKTTNTEQFQVVFNF